jgi:hypothetical protein
MFTPLIAGLCAMLLNAHGQSLVGIGEINGPTCDVILILGNGGMTPPMQDARLAPHRFGARIGANEALVIVDNEEFIVPRGIAL